MLARAGEASVASAPASAPTSSTEFLAMCAGPASAAEVIDPPKHWHRTTLPLDRAIARPAVNDPSRRTEANSPHWLARLAISKAVITPSAAGIARPSAGSTAGHGRPRSPSEWRKAR